MTEVHDILRDLVIVYGLGLVVVYLFHKVHQSPLVGFLVTGILAGPNGLSLIPDRSSVEILAEIGVMLLLFSLGLEFSLKKLLQSRLFVLGTGSIQVVATILGVYLIARYAGVDSRLAVFLGFLMALSSTALVLKTLLDREEIDSIQGRITLSILIFQDLCVVPMMVIVPLLASTGSLWWPLAQAVGKAILLIVAVTLVARLLFPTLLHQIVKTRAKELLIITSILMFLGTAWIVAEEGFSLALGSFLAGLILSESEYGHQIFADVRPFRDSLNSLFFISIGMLVSPVFLFGNFPLILGIVAAIVVGKALLAAVAVKAIRLPWHQATLVGLSLAQIGEFSFVLLEAGSKVGLVAVSWYQLLISAAVGTMMLTPTLFAISRKMALSVRAFAGVSGRDAALEDGLVSAPLMQDHVIICGFGVSGRNVARVLKVNQVPYLILELNPQRVSQGKKNGEPIFFGDCTDSTILTHAGVQRARVVVFATSDPFSTRRAVQAARSLNRDVIILTRTKYLAEIDDLYQLGATEVVAEEFEASLELLTYILGVYHFPRTLVAAEVRAIRRQRYLAFQRRRARVPRLRLSQEVDIFAETVAIPEGSPLCHRTIADSQLRTQTRIWILGIIRQSETISNPGPLDLILPGDRSVLSGTKDQLNLAMQQLK